MFTFRVPIADEKTRRIAARRPSQTNASINPNIPVHTTDHVQITETNASSTSELIKSQINAAIPNITNSVIAALSAHGLIFPGNSTSDRKTCHKRHFIEINKFMALNQW